MSDQADGVVAIPVELRDAGARSWLLEQVARHQSEWLALVAQNALDGSGDLHAARVEMLVKFLDLHGQAYLADVARPG